MKKQTLKTTKSQLTKLKPMTKKQMGKIKGGEGGNFVIIEQPLP